MKARANLPVFVEAKKVNEAGNVTGLKPMAGKKVLVLRMPEAPAFDQAMGMLHDLKAQARVQGRIAVKELHRLRERHLRHEVPGARRLMEALPPEARPAVRKADAWIRANALKLEKRAERLLQ